MAGGALVRSLNAPHFALPVLGPRLKYTAPDEQSLHGERATSGWRNGAGLPSGLAWRAASARAAKRATTAFKKRR